MQVVMGVDCVCVMGCCMQVVKGGDCVCVMGCCMQVVKGVDCVCVMGVLYAGCKGCGLCFSVTCRGLSTCVATSWPPWTVKTSRYVRALGSRLDQGTKDQGH